MLLLLLLAAGALVSTSTEALTDAEAHARDLGVYAFSCPLDSNRNIINGTYADPDNCNLYYHCNAGLQWVRQCPPNQDYQPNADALQCYFRVCVNKTDSYCVQNDERAKAKYELVREELEAQEQALREEMENNADDYYPCYKDEYGNWVDITLPNRQNCRQYYHCTGGQSFPSECPPFTYYTPDIGWQGPQNGTCQFQACFNLEDAKCAIDGEWGEWGAWGDCSAPCGDGVQIRRRECNDPPPSNKGDDCPGYDFEPRVCNEGPCRDNGTAVFVYRTTDINTGTTEVDPIDFRGVLANTDGSYSINDDTFTCNQAGYYFHGISAGVLALQQGHAYVKNTGSTTYPSLGVRRSHTNHIGRDGGISNQAIFSMSQGDVINMAAAASTTLTSDQGKPSSWTVFEINEIAGTTKVIFSVAYDSGATIPSNPLQYDTILVNEGSAYDPATGHVDINTPGIYFLCFSTGVDTTSVARDIDVTMSCSGNCGSEQIRLQLSRGHNVYQGIDSMSRCGLMRLPVGTFVSVTSANAYYSSSNLLASFSGFLYAPPIQDDRVAFFVARTGSWSDSTVLDPVSFNVEVLNEGGGWGDQGLDNYFVAPQEGYYYIFMSAGASAGERVDIRLFKNDEYMIDLYRQSIVHTDVDTLARGSIMPLEAGDRLRLRATANTGLYSSSIGHETSFGGFLLFRGPANARNKAQAEEYLQKMKL
jgi:hypothetical protein